MAKWCYRRSRPLGLCAASLVLLAAANAYVITQAQTQTQTYTCEQGFIDEVAAPVVLMSPLSGVANPVIPRDPLTGQRMLREDLVDYVANLDAAIRLGKALFWDMQAGSDNLTACATCHFQAGQDGRTRNQVHPGPNGAWDGPQFAPNSQLFEQHYPFAPAEPDVDNITGSQGVRRSTFQAIAKGGTEQTTPVLDPVFNVNGINVRQVTGRNAPSVINAVFNHRNFHDGRAQAEFNGVNPFGSRDPSARVWVVSPLGPTQLDVLIHEASLASQAVGPALNDVEMSATGRTWPDLGRKLMSVKPLGLQKVDAGDSVLGAYADTAAGLKTTYKAMIQAAFRPKWWNTTKSIRINGRSYTMMEANTSLFWGLAIMLYEATLVADRSPIDRYLETRAAGAPDPMVLDELAAQLSAEFQQSITSADIINGLRLFELPPPPAAAPNGVGCMLCHVGAETTGASSRNLNHGVEADDIIFQNAGFDQRMERMFWRIPSVDPTTTRVTLNPLAWTVTEYNPAAPGGADVPLAVYDTGYYNIGVRPSADDPGTDGSDPFGNSWSVVRLLQAMFSDPSFIRIPGAGLNCGATVVTNSTGFPLLSGSLRKAERVGVAGSFKTPGLRNVEFTGPYFHNGGKSTLLQVLELYDDGGDFVNATRAPLIRPLGLVPSERRDLVAFMLALTDDRVRWQQAPFDHPQLFVPNGDRVPGADDLVEIPAVGAGGGTPLRRFLNLNPFSQ